MPLIPSSAAEIINAARAFIHCARGTVADLTEPGACTPALAARRLADIEVRKIRAWPQPEARKRMLAEMRGQAVVERLTVSDAEGPAASFYTVLIEKLAEAHDAQ